MSETPRPEEDVYAKNREIVEKGIQYPDGGHLRQLEHEGKLLDGGYIDGLTPWGLETEISTAENYVQALKDRLEQLKEKKEK